MGSLTSPEVTLRNTRAVNNLSLSSFTALFLLQECLLSLIKDKKSLI